MSIGEFEILSELKFSSRTGKATGHSPIVQPPFHSGIPHLALKLVRLDTNGTNTELFHTRFQYILAKSDVKKFRIFTPLTHFEGKSDIPTNNKAGRMNDLF